MEVRTSELDELCEAVDSYNNARAEVHKDANPHNLHEYRKAKEAVLLSAISVADKLEEHIND